VVTEFGGVRLKDAVLQVARPKVDPNVQQVQKVSRVVEAEPEDQRLAGHFLIPKENIIKMETQVWVSILRDPLQARIGLSDPSPHLECEPVIEYPEVVEESQGDDHGPVVAQTSGRIEDERPSTARLLRAGSGGIPFL